MEKLDFVTVATFANAEEANFAREMLAQEGFRTCLEGEVTVGMLWHLGNAVGGIKLQVAAEEAERARALLAQSVADDTSTFTPRVCRQCGAEGEPGFAACWSCGAAFDAAESPTATAPIVTPSETTGEAVQPLEEEGEGDAAARRAWRAAVIGLFVCPPLLHFYSVGVLIHLGASGLPLSSRGRRCQRWAWIANLAIGAATGAVIHTVRSRL